MTRTMLAIWTAVTAVVTATMISGSAAYAVDSTPKGITPVAPCVLLDTGQATGGFTGPLQGGQSIDIQATGALGALQGGAGDCQIPAGVSAVMVNVIADSPLRAGNLRAYPTGETTSGGVVNFSVQTPALRNSNAVIIPVSTAGQMTIYANAGPTGVGLDTTDVVVTVIGYLSTNGMVYTPVTPCAFTDSRVTQGATGGYAGPFVGNETRTVQLTSSFPPGQGGGNSSCGVLFTAQAALINLVAANPTGSGEIGIRAAGEADTTTYVSYSGLTPPMNNSNAVIVPLSAGGELDLYSVAGNGNTTEVRAEVVGYLSNFGDEYVPLPPCAIFDSRVNQGASGGFVGPYDGGEFRTFQITGTFSSSQGGGNTDCGVPSGATGVMLNVEGVNPVHAGNFKAYAAGTTPSGGIVNFAALNPAMNNANAAIVPLSANGEMNLESNGGPAGLGLPTAQARGVVMGYTQRSSTEVSAQVTGPLSFRPPANLPAVSPVTITGDAYNPQGVDEVIITVSDQVGGAILFEFAANQYAFSTQLTSNTLLTSLGSSGSTSTTWSFGPIDLEAGGGSGHYSVSVWVNGQPTGGPLAIHSFSTAAQSPPTVTYESPADGAILPDVASAWGTASDEEGIFSVSVSVRDVATNQYLTLIGGSRAWVNGNASLPAIYNPSTGEWHIDLHGPSMNGRTLEIVRVGASDVGGSTSAIFPGAQITIGADNTPPQISVGTPTSGQLLPDPPTISGTASDLAGVSSLELQVLDLTYGLMWDGYAWQVPNNDWFAANLPGTNWSNANWTFTFPDPNPMPFGSGNFRMWARATDTSGNVTTTGPIDFNTIADNVGPVVTVATPSGGWASVPFTADGNATDATGVSALLVTVQDTASGDYWDGSGWTASLQSLPANLTAPNASSTGWSLPIFQPNEAGGSGDYTITVTALDLGANASVTGPIAFSSDTVAPTISVTQPTPSQAYADPNLSVKGLAADSNGLDGLELTLVDTDSGKWYTGSGWSNTPTTFPATYDNPGSTSSTWSIAVDLTGAAGPFQVLATATDVAGNSSDSSTVTFHVDTTNPTISVGTPFVGESLNAPFMVSGTADDNLEIDVVELLIQDQVTGLFLNGSVWGAPGQWHLASYSAATSSWFVPGLDTEVGPGSGSYHLRARATDSVGNLGFSALVPFTVTDQIDPAVVIASPTEGAWLASPVVITGTATDNRVVSGVNLRLREWACGTRYWNGTGWQSTATTYPATITTGTGTGSVSWSNAPGVTQAGGCGRYHLQATSVDSSGNVSPIFPLGNNEVDFSLDTEDPVVSVASPVNNSVGALPVSLNGLVSDDQIGLPDVTLTLTDTDTGEFWNGTGWQPSSYNLIASTGATTWIYPFPSGALPGGHLNFGIVVTATDDVGRQTTTSMTQFAVLPIAWDLTLDSPTTFTTRPMTLSGAALSIEEVDTVEVQIIELSSIGSSALRYWTGAGWSNSSPAPWVPATITPTGPYSADWTYQIDPGDGSRGIFEVNVRLVTNASTTHLLAPAPLNYFPGLNAPSILAPLANQTWPLGLNNYSGKHISDIKVLNVEYEIFSVTTGQWKTLVGWSATQTQVTAPGFSLTYGSGVNYSWSQNIGLPVGDYELRIRHRTFEGWSPWSPVRHYEIQ